MWFPECVYVCDMCVIVVQIIYKINNLKLIQYHLPDTDGGGAGGREKKLFLNGHNQRVLILSAKVITTTGTD